jgi:putative Mg2+ transporter-C (MgtC) family protein
MLGYHPVSSFDISEVGEVILKLVVSGLCGALIGWEREVREKAAGLRTHSLVALGSCLFTILSLRLASEALGADPMRVVQGLLMGLGFLAGGVIFREGASVKGLTTAAGLWVLGAVGLAIGMGRYVEGILGTVFAFLVLDIVPRIEGKMKSQAERKG